MKRAIKLVNQRFNEQADGQQRALEVRAMKYLHRFAAILSLGLGTFGTLANGSTAGKVSVAAVSTLIALVANWDKIKGGKVDFTGEDRRNGN